MPNCGNSMLKENLSEKCKRQKRNKRKLRIQWLYLTGKETRDRFKDSRKKLDKLRNAKCLNSSGLMKKKEKRKLNSKSSCSIERET